MNIELPIEDLTWGELRAFVALAAHHEDDEEVLVTLDPRGEEVQSIFIVGVAATEIVRCRRGGWDVLRSEK
jgi:hypothetical protein